MTELLYFYKPPRGELGPRIMGAVLGWDGESFEGDWTLYTRSQLKSTRDGRAALAAWERGDFTYVDREKTVRSDVIRVEPREARINGWGEVLDLGIARAKRR